jgi:hypothetical protein
VKIIIDCDYDASGMPFAFQYFETDDTQRPQILNPADNKTPMKALDYLKYMSANPTFMIAAGWNEVTNLPGAPQGTTRWGALINQVNAPNADPAIKQLGLV